jgi:hypothetical protein
LLRRQEIKGESAMRSGFLYPLLAAAIGYAAVGCRMIDTPSAVVAPAVTATESAPKLWLESATLVCLPSPAPPVALPPVEVELASFAPAIKPSSVESPPPARTVTVLAIRYPHPDGRRDVARAELIVVDPAAQASADTSWRPRLGRALTSALPGVAWGPGIRRAVGLDVPVRELQEVVAAAQQPPAVGAGESSPGTSLVRLDVNGRPATIASSSPPQLAQLAQRVARDGRVISYRGPASELLAAAGR